MPKAQYLLPTTPIAISFHFLRPARSGNMRAGDVQDDSDLTTAAHFGGAKRHDPLAIQHCLAERYRHESTKPFYAHCRLQLMRSICAAHLIGRRLTQGRSGSFLHVPKRLQWGKFQAAGDWPRSAISGSSPQGPNFLTTLFKTLLNLYVVLYLIVE